MSKRTSHRMMHGLLLVLLATTVPACVSWKHTELAPVPDSVSAPAREMRVVMRAGNKVTLRDVLVRNDTLHAVLMTRDRHSQRSSMAIPMSQIVDMQTRKVSAPKTIAATAGNGFVAVVVGGVIAFFAAGGGFVM